jgi:hypothetical protein
VTHYLDGPEGYCAVCNRIEAAYLDGTLYYHYQVDGVNRCKGAGQKAWPLPATPEVEEFAFLTLDARACQRVFSLEGHRAHEYTGPMGRHFWCEGLS